MPIFLNQPTELHIFSIFRILNNHSFIQHFMELHDLINKQKGKLQSILAKTELALGEIIF